MWEAGLKGFPAPDHCYVGVLQEAGASVVRTASAQPSLLHVYREGNRGACPGREKIEGGKGTRTSSVQTKELPSSTAAASKGARPPARHAFGENQRPNLRFQLLLGRFRFSEASGLKMRDFFRQAPSPTM